MKKFFLPKKLVMVLLGMGVLLRLIACVPDAYSADVPRTQISHELPFSFSEKSPLPMEAVVTDPAGVAEVRCYFRFNGSLPFVYGEMTETRKGVFSMTLPIPISAVQRVEYLFLVVNGHKQAILSQTFTLNKNNIGNGYSTGVQNIGSERHQLKAEVDGAGAVEKFFLQSTNVVISLVPQQDHYGVLAGLYSREQLDSEVVSGYFGAFRLDPKKGMVAVKGYIVTRRSGDRSLPQEKSTNAKEAVTKEDVPVLDIAGNNWKGVFWRSDNYARTVVPVTAVVTKNSEGWVTITTNLEGLGHYLEGRIYNSRYMLLYDAYDGEDWTTHYGPATDYYIKIADYIRPGTVEDPSPPLNIIELTRDRKLKAPISAINMLLL